jgi:hypothetical protein
MIRVGIIKPPKKLDDPLDRYFRTRSNEGGQYMVDAACVRRAHDNADERTLQIGYLKQLT